MPRGLAGLRPLLISSGEQYLTVAIERAEREKLEGYLAARGGEGREGGVLSRVENSARARIYMARILGKIESISGIDPVEF